MNVHGFHVLQASSVTLSMEVSYTFHSHMIGRSGQNINRLMDETGTRIHFPDRNRMMGEPKCNNVVIRGQLVNLEKARQRIRVWSILQRVSCFYLNVLISFIRWIFHLKLLSTVVQKGFHPSVNLHLPITSLRRTVFCYVSIRRLTDLVVKLTYEVNKIVSSSSRMPLHFSAM